MGMCTDKTLHMDPTMTKPKSNAMLFPSMPSSSARDYNLIACEGLLSSHATLVLAYRCLMNWPSAA